MITTFLKLELARIPLRLSNTCCSYLLGAVSFIAGGAGVDLVIFANSCPHAVQYLKSALLDVLHLVQKIGELKLIFW
jgi:hypothetical protein